MAAPEQPTIREAVAAFDDPEALKAAVSDLQSHGFDRADISFLAREGFEGHLAQQYPDMQRAEDESADDRPDQPDGEVDDDATTSAEYQVRQPASQQADDDRSNDAHNF